MYPFYHFSRDKKTASSKLLHKSRLILAPRKQITNKPPVPTASNSCSERERVERQRGRLMRKTADWTKGGSPLHTREEEEARPQFTYSVEVPRPLEGKSLFETHCSLVCYTSSSQTEYVCVCVRTHTWTFPTQKLCKPCLYKSERGKEREGERGRNVTWYWTERRRERREEEEGKGGYIGGKKDFLTLQLLLW